MLQYLLRDWICSGLWGALDHDFILTEEALMRGKHSYAYLVHSISPIQQGVSAPWKRGSSAFWLFLFLLQDTSRFKVSSDVLKALPSI